VIRVEHAEDEKSPGLDDAFQLSGPTVHQRTRNVSKHRVRINKVELPIRVRQRRLYVGRLQLNSIA
jgi:hypothetical protein